MIFTLHALGLEWWLIATAVLILLGGAAITGFRLHRWLFYNMPSIGRRLPADTGVYAGIAVAAALLLL